MVDLDPTTVSEPLFYTEGGGIVREVATQIDGLEYYFIQAPDPAFGLGVGDRMPDMWGIVPANQAAREPPYEG